jgi:hypothetical protein
MNTSAVVLYLVTWPSQRAPESDMILVHDDDLSRISGICDSDVNKHHMSLVSVY